MRVRGTRWVFKNYTRAISRITIRYQRCFWKLYFFWIATKLLPPSPIFLLFVDSVAVILVLLPTLLYPTFKTKCDVIFNRNNLKIEIKTHIPPEANFIATANPSKRCVAQPPRLFQTKFHHLKIFKIKIRVGNGSPPGSSIWIFLNKKILVK